MKDELLKVSLTLRHASVPEQSAAYWHCMLQHEFINLETWLK